MKFLIVEDDPDLLRVLVDVLMIEGALPIGASLGVIALQLLSTFSFSMILLDLNLPDMEGWQVLEAASAIYPRIPVIIITATDSDSARRRARLHGVQDFVIKPVSARELVSLMKEKLTDPDLQLT